MKSRIQDRSWAPLVPDEVKEYLQFQATEKPSCVWAEGLCIKYHTLSTIRFVMGADSVVGECMTDDNVWESVVEHAGGLSSVSPVSVNAWLNSQIMVAEARACGEDEDEDYASMKERHAEVQA
tara:strand:+ start:811 stop:1179 length:369 start_codon:yes stop_codon:yes gene_type:complete